MFRKLSCKNEKKHINKKKLHHYMIVVEDGEELHDLTMNIKENPKRNENMEKFARGCWAWSNVKNQIYLS